MIAVLLGSTKKGASKWANVRGLGCLRFLGLQEGDLLRAHFRHTSGSITVEVIESDGVIAVPEATVMVRVEHIDASGSPVHVDIRS